jgi:hypothetical protein
VRVGAGQALEHRDGEVGGAEEDGAQRRPRR